MYNFNKFYSVFLLLFSFCQMCFTICQMTFQFFKCQNDISNEIPLFSNHFHFIQNAFLINLIDLDKFFLSKQKLYFIFNIINTNNNNT
jgi:hypothetical protein